MRFKELIENNAHRVRPTKNIDQNEISDFIIKNCQPWIEATNLDYPIYRGIREVRGDTSNKVSFVKRVRVNRKPKDSRPALHHAYNILLDHVGSYANRTNSLFVTGSRAAASEFGTVYMVFPIGNFNYTWSPYFTDWTREFRNEQIADLLKPGILNKDVISASLSYYDNIHPQFKDAIKNKENFRDDEPEDTILVDRDLERAIKLGHEIMIRCKSALFVDPIFYENPLR